MKITRSQLRKLIVETIAESAAPMPGQLDGLIEDLFENLMGELTGRMEEEAAEYTKQCILDQLGEGKIPFITLTPTSTRECVIRKFMSNAPKHALDALDVVLEMAFEMMPDFLGSSIPGIGGNIKIPGGLPGLPF